MTEPSTSSQEKDLRARVERALAPAYEIEGELGRGGAGIVYRAKDIRLKRSVAVKVLPPDLAFRSDVRDRFMREAETSARLTHPNIVPIYSVDEKEGLAYFVMALIEGENLGERVRMRGALPIPETTHILHEVADALAYAHGKGVVHRDIKPDNILIDGQSGRAMVTDFGIARAATEGDSRLTATGTAIGTPAYMSPEQCAGDRQLDGRSDLYSLGAVAYYMLTGKPPFDGPTTPVVMMKQVTERPVSIERLRPGVPDNLQRVVMKLLEKDPASRFVDGEALVSALDGAPVDGGYETRSHYPTLQTSYPSLADTMSGTSSLRPQMGGLFPPMLPWGPAQIGRMARREVRQMRHDVKRERKEEKEQRENARPLPDRIRSFKRHLASYAGTTVFFFGVNFVTGGPHPFWWAFFPVMGMGMGLMSEWGNMWAAGVRFRDIFNSSPVLPTGVPSSALPASGAPAPTIESTRLAPEVLAGARGSTVRQAGADRRTVHDLMSRLSDPEKKMLPDVGGTADGLYERIIALAAALHRIDGEIDPARVTALDDRIGRAEQSGEGAADRDRLLRLLKRQREMLTNLIKSRDTLSEQFESAGLLLQNLTLDLLKMRSSGFQSALNDVTSVTQEARALSREIGYVLAAADELREIDKAT